MPIDWFTVAAQAVNFLILLVLLRRFLYRPVLAAMDRREARIAERLQEADEHRETARREQERLAAERAEFDASRADLLQSARDEAEHQRHQAIADARLEADRRAEAWRADLRRQEQQLVSDLVATMAERVRSGLAEALEHLAGRDLRTAVLERLLERLTSLEEADRRELAAVLRNQDIELRLAATPPPVARERLLQALAELGADPTAIRLHEDASLIAGAQVRAGGRRIDWSLARFAEDAGEAVRRELMSAAGGEHDAAEASDASSGPEAEDADAA